MSRYSIRKEIFINHGRKTTVYSLGKNTLDARIYYGTKAEAKAGLKKIQNATKKRR